MKIIHLKKALGLTVVTLVAIFSCNCLYAFGGDSTSLNIVDTNNKLIEENKRLTNVISQYAILVRGLQNENNELKQRVQEYENYDKETSMIYLGEFTLTYYCTENYEHICGGGGTTASGTKVTPGRSVSVDTSVIPLGSTLYIEGIGFRVAEDTGGAVNGNKIDIAVETHSEAINNGVNKNVNVWIVK